MTEAKKKEATVKREAARPGKVALFLRDIRAEWKKVTWLNRPEVKNRVGITMAGVAAIALLTTGVDRAVQALLSLFL